MKKIILSIPFILMILPLNAQTADTTFKPSGKPVIQVFGEASYNVNDDFYRFSINRAHLGYQFQYSPKWSSLVIIDAGKPTIVGQITVSDSAGNIFNVKNQSKEGAFNTMFLKFASIKFKPIDKLTFEGGLILQNHFMTQLRFWQLRYLAPHFMNMSWKITCTDIGFIGYYKFNQFVSFDAAITNGEGPRLDQDKFGNVKYAFGIDVYPADKIQTRVFYHNKQSGQNGVAPEHLLSCFLGVKPTKRSRIGGEFNYMYNLQNSDGLDSYGYSLYVAYNIVKSIELFAHFDQLFYDEPDGNTTTIKGNGIYFQGGVSYTPVRIIRLSLNYQGFKFENENTEMQNNLLFSMEFSL